MPTKRNKPNAASARGFDANAKLVGRPSAVKQALAGGCVPELEGASHSLPGWWLETDQLARAEAAA